jgi:transmembrane sensor
MNMSATSERVRGLIAQEAADWFVANRGGLAAREREHFSAWLHASPVHVEEYLGVAVVARDLRQACALSQGDLEELIARGHQQEKVVHSPWPRAFSAVRAVPAHQFRMAAIALVIGVMTIAAFAWWHLKSGTAMLAAAPVVQHFHTTHGQQMTQRLADGSLLHLNTDSAATVEYREQERRVRLTAGEAVFEVAHDSARAFRVFAGQAQVVAVGTRFNVRLREELTTVTVAEGRVQVGPLPPAPTPGANLPSGSAGVFVQVAADQQIRYSQDAWPATPEYADAQRTTSWLHRQITFEREPLERVASEFNRYSHKPIEIATPALRKLEISGAFATDDTEAFVAFLRSLDGVHVEVTAARIRVSQGAAAPVH